MKVLAEEARAKAPTPPPHTNHENCSQETVEKVIEKAIVSSREETIGNGISW